LKKKKNDRGQGEEADNSGYFAEDEELYDCSQGAIALERVNRLYMVLGWISAVMALFTTPFARNCRYNFRSKFEQTKAKSRQCDNYSQCCGCAD